MITDERLEQLADVKTICCCQDEEYQEMAAELLRLRQQLSEPALYGSGWTEWGGGGECREQFEEWYSKMMGTPLSVLENLRGGEQYKCTEGDRLDIAWQAWCASREPHKVATRPIPEQQARDANWIEWGGGGERPVDAQSCVDVKLRNGDVIHGWLSSSWQWDHCGEISDIVAYRSCN